MKKTVDYKQASQNYHVYGEGIAVLLIHGFPETNAIWKNQTTDLSKFCKLIVPDLAGSGESGMPGLSEKKLSIDELAESIHAILQNENIEECIMLGHSMGGYITLAYADKHPEKLIAFGFIHSTAAADSDEKKQSRLKGIEMMELYGSYAFVKATTPNLFAEEFKKKHTGVVNELVAAGKQFQKENLQQYYYAMMNRPDRTQVLKNTRLPVLFVMGTDDKTLLLNDALKQVHLPEIAYIHIIENAGHMSMLEKPDELNVILEKFVNEFV